MSQNENVTFEEFFKQNTKRIHYHMHKLGSYNPYHEFYTEGLYELWMAYKKYEPNKGSLATYFNCTIHKRLIDMKTNKRR
ncbi:sigma factor [Virgibacillus sp. L01]|uniref:sigma factor n=1 Tax=Virgibacillus sp. L01 TaxID=3457429 RepID=UPI003FD51DE6